VEVSCPLLGKDHMKLIFRSGNGLASYYIDKILGGIGITEAETKAIINGCLQIFNFVIAIGASLLVDVAGRRPLFLISNTGMLLAFAAWTVASALFQSGHSLVAGKGSSQFLHFPTEVLIFSELSYPSYSSSTSFTTWHTRRC